MRSLRLILMLSFCCTIVLPAFAQSVGDCVFLQGKYVEVGVAPNGGYGSTLPAPSSYHSFLSSSLSLYDPGTGTSSSSTNFLGFVADYGRDGWATGTPAFWGDYYLPGTPQEGWAVQVGTAQSTAYIPAYTTTGATGFTGTLTGGNTGYSSTGGVSKAYWQGSQGALRIRQTTIVDTNKLFFIVNVILVNTGATTLNDIYYMRTLDPDNEQTRSGSFTTNNTIAYQLPNADNKVLVSAVGNGAFSSNAYLGLGTKDCRAKCFVLDAGLTPTDSISEMFNERGSNGHYNLGYNSVVDVGVGLIFNVGSLGPNDSTSLTYTYILNAAYIDSALDATQPIPRINNTTTFNVGDTIDLCQYRSPTLNVSLENGGFYRWTWAPNTNISGTTGISNDINVSALTGLTVYTITGVNNSGSCDTVVYYIPIKYMNISGAILNPDSTICYGSPVQARVSGSPTYDYRWSPAAGVSNTTLQNPILTPTATTTYTLTISSATACAPITRTLRLSVTRPILDSFSMTPPTYCGASDGIIYLYGRDLVTGAIDTLNYTKAGVPQGPISIGVSSSGRATISRLNAATYNNFQIKVGQCTTNVIGPAVLANPAPPTVTVASSYLRTCVGTPVSLSASATPAATVPFNYAWTPPSYLSNSTISNPIMNPTTSGDFNYTVTANPGTDPACAGSATLTVHVVDPFQLTNRDTAICIGRRVDARIIGYGSSEYSYVWSPATGVSDPYIQNPTITPTVSGTWSVTGSYASCPDRTLSFSIEVDTPARPVTVTDTICLGMSDSFNVRVPGTSDTSRGADYYTYSWAPPAGVSNTTIADPIITPTTLGGSAYTVTISPNARGCSATSVFNIFVLPNSITISPTDTAICLGDFVQVVGTGDPIFQYQWRPTSGIAISNVLNAFIRPDTSATYVVTASFHRCPDITASMHLDVQPKPNVYLGGNRALCQFDTLRIESHVTPSWYTRYIYDWTPGTDLDDSTMPNAIFRGTTTTKIYLTVTTPAGCIGRDSLVVNMMPGNFASLTPNTMDFCPRTDTVLSAIAPSGTTYRWYPSVYLSDSTSGAPRISPLTSQIYTVVATSANGCVDTFNFTAFVHPGAVISLEDSVRLYPGETYHLEPMTNCTSLRWFPPTGLDNDAISNPIASPTVSTKYYVEGVTAEGCKIADTIVIYVSDESFFALPNAFNPSNGNASWFRIIQRGDMKLDHFRVYNRWGNLMFETTDVNEGWDGTYNGTPQPFGVYIYEVEAITNNGRSVKRQGNVTLIR